MEKSTIKSSLSLKIFIIGFLIFILMIPTGMIALLVNERQDRQEEAVREVSEKWGSAQTITGPVLSVPYNKNMESVVNGVKSNISVVQYAHFLPNKLMVDGKINPETRKRGIYEVVVYNSELKLSGEFVAPDFNKWGIKMEDVMFDKAFVSVGIPDMRGVKENINLLWDNSELAFMPGIETKDVLVSGVSVVVPNISDNKNHAFSLNLSLNGSRDLMFSPIGKETEVKITSSWTDPSFQGAFLPNNYEINDNGFTADWKVLELNRNFPQSFLGSASFESNLPINNGQYEKFAASLQSGDFGSSNFGVRLLIPADEYQKTVRALKYAILTLALTFLVLFFFEALRKKKVHPMQYILIGLALSLFYVLLLSLAEYIGFDLAYLLSSVATVGLIKLYSKSIFKAWTPAVIESSILAFIYVFIYVILQLEDFSLLVGSIGLFVILASIMYASRKIDWYNLGSSEEK